MTAREIARQAGLSPSHFVAPARFRHNESVTLTDAHGVEHQGTLHLPPETLYGARGPFLAPQVTDGGYGVHTIIRNGAMFRTEGRLS